MTAQIIQFVARPAPVVEEPEFAPFPPDTEDLVSLLSVVFERNCHLFGWPDVADYSDYVWAYEDDRYPGTLLLDVDTPSHAKGTFCIKANSYELARILDLPLVYCR